MTKADWLLWRLGKARAYEMLAAGRAGALRPSQTERELATADLNHWAHEVGILYGCWKRARLDDG